MKKIFAIASVIVIIVSMSACGSNEVAPTTVAPTTASIETALLPTETAIPEIETADSSESDQTESLTEEPTSLPTQPVPEPTTEPVVETEPKGTTYVLNTNSNKFHESGCSSVTDMKESNKKVYTGTREEVIAMGYSPCGRCNP